MAAAYNKSIVPTGVHGTAPTRYHYAAPIKHPKACGSHREHALYHRAAFDCHTEGQETDAIVADYLQSAVFNPSRTYGGASVRTALHDRTNGHLLYFLLYSKLAWV